jgi:hypothetical protein
MVFFPVRIDVVGRYPRSCTFGLSSWACEIDVDVCNVSWKAAVSDIVCGRIKTDCAAYCLLKNGSLVWKKEAIERKW